MDPDMEEAMKEYAAMDLVASEILSDKQQIVDLDAKRNKTREALRKLKETEKSDPTCRHHWMCFGNTFIKIDTSDCVKMMEKDQRTLDVEIEKIRDELKPKVSKLHKMEGKAEAKGFNLKGMKLERELAAQNYSTSQS